MTTKELEPCPFCGGEAMVMESSDGFTSVGCANDGCPTMQMIFPLMFSFDSKDRAIEAWNTRYKRTCHFTYEKDEYPVHFGKWECTSCGKWWMYPPFDLDNIKFCPNCGAEVTDGD